jgi:hypothetical protein
MIPNYRQCVVAARHLCIVIVYIIYLIMTMIITCLRVQKYQQVSFLKWDNIITTIDIPVAGTRCDFGQLLRFF